jgi:hypothetical protein
MSISKKVLQGGRGIKATPKVGFDHVGCSADTQVIQGDLDGSVDSQDGSPDPGGRTSPILNLLALGGLKTAGATGGIIPKPQMAKAKRRASQAYLGELNNQM